MSCASAQNISYPNKKDKTIVRMKSFFAGYGKIMNNENYLVLSTAKAIITPSADDVHAAEQLMNDKFADLIGTDERLKILKSKSYKDEYYEFYRQYVGLINDQDEKVVIIHLIRCCKGNIQKCFPNWKKELGSPLDEDPCTITCTYVANLSRKIISVY